ncbi:MAG: sigma-70 family RNA polymerase sigma factor [Chloroflexi bacterium]|nr:sigma-70 family RNA polymerase sigma factor [Chloroflexota bacterium]
MKIPDSEWLPLALQGNEEAFTRVVEHYQTPVYNLCYRMLGSPQEAEDAAQETFWRAYRNLNRYDPNRSFMTWILSIAAHYCIDQHRRQRINMLPLEGYVEDTSPDPAPNPEAYASQSEEAAVLRSLLDGLNPQDRAAIILRYWYDLSEMEIAQTLNLTVSAVKSRLHRARITLGQRWQAAHPSAVPERRHDESPAF